MWIMTIILKSIDLEVYFEWSKVLHFTKSQNYQVKLVPTRGFLSYYLI